MFLYKYKMPLLAVFFCIKFKYYDGNRVLYRKSLIARACIIVLYQGSVTKKHHFSISMKTIYLFISIVSCLYPLQMAYSQPILIDSVQISTLPKINNTEDKVFGLSKIWSEIKYNFVSYLFLIIDIIIVLYRVIYKRLNRYLLT